MEDGFMLPVRYKGEEVEFSSSFIQTGYTSRFNIIVNHIELSFEKDDEGNFRVINYNPESAKEVPTDLLEAIITSLQKITD